MRNDYHELLLSLFRPCLELEFVVFDLSGSNGLVAPIGAFL